jgi:undecaprenyl-diphosphatase
MKTVVDQERPDRRTVRGHWRGIPLSGEKYDAFPSGHAVHVGALMSAATLLPRRWRNTIWLIGSVLVSTRVVLLAHWLSDVIAGLAIGVAVERLLRPSLAEHEPTAHLGTFPKSRATGGFRARLKKS